MGFKKKHFINAKYILHFHVNVISTKLLTENAEALNGSWSSLTFLVSLI